MVRDQMVCIIAPPLALSLTRLQRARGGLDALFERIGRIHFAAMALLPPRTDVADRRPSLLLELAVDDELRPADLVDLLVQHGFEQLWFVYGAYWEGGKRASKQTRRDWLRDFLLEHLHRADGGFVGARDRSVGQIRAEARLFKAARTQLYQRPVSPTDDRAFLARSISSWAADKHAFRWAVEPALRSFWRKTWMTLPLRATLALAQLVSPFVAVLLNVLALLAFIGVLALASFLTVVDWATLLDTPLAFGAHSEWSRYAVATATIATVVMTVIAGLSVSGIRSTTVAAFLLLVFGVVFSFAIFVALYKFSAGAVLGFVGATEVLLKAGVVAVLWVVIAWGIAGIVFWRALLAVPPFLGLSAVIAVALALVLLAAGAIHWLLGLLVAWGHANGLGLYPALQQHTVLGLPAIDAIAILVFAVFSACAYLISRWLKLPPFSGRVIAIKMDKLEPHELKAGHQVHPSIEECEGQLAASGRTSHMFSLTDVRQPYWLCSRTLRFYLWLVTYIGHTVFTEGKLANAEGIRFGHWHVIEKGRRLLFCSNFDGAFGGYLDEFINGASEGINLFWRWTELLERPAAVEGHPAVARSRDFPPTRFGIFGGCKYEQWFKTYARDSMLPHVYRFEAYKYSAQDVERATRLRDSLFGPRTAVTDDQVMRALES